LSFQISPEALLIQLEKEAAKLEIKIERLTQERIRSLETGNTRSAVPLQIAQRRLAEIEPQIEILKIEIQLKEKGDDLPQITPQNNTLRNALLIGATILLLR